MNPVVLPDREHVSLRSFVRDRRVANHLYQRQLADLAGVGLRFIHDLERDKVTLRMDKVNQVLAVFGKQLGIVDAARRDDG